MSDEKFTEGVEYREVPGFPGYIVGDDGTVWSEWSRGGYLRGGSGSCPSVRTGRWVRLKPGLRRGYPFVSIKLGDRRVNMGNHTLVLIAFVGPRPSGMVARHFPDRDRGNCHLSNLQWGTRKENSADQKFHGTTVDAEKNGNAKLTWEHVNEIRRLCAAGITQRSMAKKFGVSTDLVFKIVNNKLWHDASYSPPPSRHWHSLSWNKRPGWKRRRKE